MFFALMDDIKNARGAAAPPALPPPTKYVYAGEVHVDAGLSADAGST